MLLRRVVALVVAVGMSGLCVACGGKSDKPDSELPVVRYSSYRVVDPAYIASVNGFFERRGIRHGDGLEELPQERIAALCPRKRPHAAHVEREIAVASEMAHARHEAEERHTALEEHPELRLERS